MQKLLIATHNPAKVAELKKYFAPLEKNTIQIVSLEDIHLEEEPEETGTTFKDNAILKAQYYGDLSGLPAVSDDGGFEIAALNGEPGVKSSRWLGRKATDQELIDYTLERLQDVPEGKRQAKGKLCLAYYNPLTGTLETTEAEIEGSIALKPHKELIQGFPYRALFIVTQFGKYYDDLTQEEHDKVNHRKKAILALTPAIEKDLAYEPEEIIIEAEL